MPLGTVTLPTFVGSMGNLQWIMLTFEVVDFRGRYNAILGRSTLIHTMQGSCFISRATEGSSPCKEALATTSQNRGRIRR
jgi:hypothetical protein